MRDMVGWRGALKEYEVLADDPIMSEPKVHMRKEPSEEKKPNQHRATRTLDVEVVPLSIVVVARNRGRVWCCWLASTFKCLCQNVIATHLVDFEPFVNEVAELVA